MGNRLCKGLNTNLLNQFLFRCLCYMIYQTNDKFYPHVEILQFLSITFLIFRNFTKIHLRVMGLMILYCMVLKLKFYSKRTIKKTLHFKSVLLFSSIFNQSVPPAAELDSTAPIYF